jgi:hypothetical protein
MALRENEPHRVLKKKKKKEGGAQAHFTEEDKQTGAAGQKMEKFMVNLISYHQVKMIRAVK